MSTTYPSQPQYTLSAANDTFEVSAFVRLMALFGSAQQVLKARMQADAELGLGPIDMAALCLCQKNPGGTQQDLVKALGKDKGQIARLTGELEKQGLLLRTPDAQDGRVWRLSVTAAGAKKCSWFFAIEAELAQALFGEFKNAEQTQLDSMLTALRERMDKVIADSV